MSSQLTLRVLVKFPCRSQSHQAFPSSPSSSSSGGTVGSAQMLQLSGVGPKELLTGLGIDSVVDLPVGYNLQDHYSTSISFSVP